MADGNYAGLRGGKSAALSINARRKDEAAKERAKKPKYQKPKDDLPF